MARIVIRGTLRRSPSFFVRLRLLLQTMESFPEFSPPPREPMFNVPVVIMLLLGLLVAVQAWHATRGEAGAVDLLVDTAFVPARLSLGLGTVDLATLQADARAASEDAGNSLPSAMVEVFAGDGDPHWWTLITYAFVHADWTHLLVNAVWLLAFGSAVARRFAPVRFMLFFAFCTVAAALTQWLSDPNAVQPVIGASGAIAGMMGAALRFMFRDEIRLGPGAERQAMLPRLSLAESFRDARVLAFVLTMLGINMAVALGFQLLAPAGVKIAWQAHIGGFIAGLLAFGFFDPVPPPAREA